MRACLASYFEVQPVLPPPSRGAYRPYHYHLLLPSSSSNKKLLVTARQGTSIAKYKAGAANLVLQVLS